MTIAITEKHLGLISRIYDLVLNPGDWRDVLSEVAQAVGAKHSNLILSDFSQPEVSIQGATYSDAVKNKFRDNFAVYETPMVETLIKYPVFKFGSDDDLCNFGVHYSKLQTVEFLKNDLGTFRRTAARLNDNGVWFDALTFHYANGRGLMTKAEEQVAQIFLPHFAKVVELTRPFQILKARFQRVLAALDRFHVGVLLLNEIGLVVIKNAEAERILDEEDGLIIDTRGGLRAGSEADQSALAAAIKSAASTAKAEGLDSGKLLTARPRNSSEALLLTVSPLTETEEHDLQGAMVTVIDPHNRSVISTGGMEALFGLTTAEADVCRLMVNGHPTQDIADIRNVSNETIRSQVKSVLTKTNSSKRGDVIRLAVAVNLPVDAADSGQKN